LPGAIHIPLAELPQKLAALDRTQPIVLHCKGGGRSSIAASFLKANGIQNVSNLTGGFEAWTKDGLEVVTDGSATPATAFSKS
jgi:hydroxyacylglutathione hydrolase